MQMTLRWAALAACSACAMVSAQAATLDSVTGMSWQGFETVQAGMDAGFRLATDVEFREYLTDKGFVGGPSYYSPGAGAANFYIDGLHRYDNNLSLSNPETHQITAGLLTTASGGIMEGVIGYDYVPSQCPTPQPSGQISYCGGRSSNWAYVGSLSNGDYKVSPSSYSRMDNQYLYGAKPVNFLMVSAPVPEPATSAMVLLGLLGLVGRKSLRKAGSGRV